MMVATFNGNPRATKCYSPTNVSEENEIDLLR